MTPDTCFEQYENELNALADGIRAEFQRAGCECGEPEMDSDEEYFWFMDVRTREGKGAGVTLYLLEERCREGAGDGVALHLSSTRQGGEVGPELCPFNFTPELWCRTEGEFGHRLERVKEGVGAFVGAVVRELGCPNE